MVGRRHQCLSADRVSPTEARNGNRSCDPTVTNAFRLIGFPRPLFGCGEPAPYADHVTNAFRLIGFPRHDEPNVAWIDGNAVTNAFRLIGFPRQGARLAESPRSLSHQCLSADRVSPTSLNRVKLGSVSSGHQCLSADRVSPTLPGLLLLLDASTCHQCLSADRVSPTRIDASIRFQGREVTNAFRLIGFPRLYPSKNTWISMKSVTNAFRLIGFPRHRWGRQDQSQAPCESPMPFG